MLTDIEIAFVGELAQEVNEDVSAVLLGRAHEDASEEADADFTQLVSHLFSEGFDLSVGHDSGRTGQLAIAGEFIGVFNVSDARGRRGRAGSSVLGHSRSSLLFDDSEHVTLCSAWAYWAESVMTP